MKYLIVRLGKDRKTFEFFDAMDDLFGVRPNVNPVATASSSGTGDTGIGVTQIDDSQPEDDKNDTESALPLSTARYKVRRPKKRARAIDLEEIPQWLQKRGEE